MKCRGKTAARMLSQQQLNKLIAENESLRLQLEEMNTVVFQREEELLLQYEAV